MAVFALGVAFFSATQDIAIDAWRIESATADKQGAMAAAYQIGYRTALMVASAGALIIADESGFRTSYFTMAGLVLIGVATTLLIQASRCAKSRQRRRSASSASRTGSPVARIGRNGRSAPARGSWAPRWLPSSISSAAMA